MYTGRDSTRPLRRSARTSARALVCYVLSLLIALPAFLAAPPQAALADDIPQGGVSALVDEDGNADYNFLYGRGGFDSYRSSAGDPGYGQGMFLYDTCTSPTRTSEFSGFAMAKIYVLRQN